MVKSNTSAYNLVKGSFEFIYSKSLSRTYSFGLNSFPSGFDSKNTTVVLGPNNQKWLEMFVVPNRWTTTTNTSSIMVFIYDYSKEAMLYLHDDHLSCYLDFIAPIDAFSNSTGLFISGCPK